MRTMRSGLRTMRGHLQPIGKVERRGTAVAHAPDERHSLGATKVHETWFTTAGQSVTLSIEASKKNPCNDRSWRSSPRSTSARLCGQARGDALRAGGGFGVEGGF
jgi:hypothetical protein